MENYFKDEEILSLEKVKETEDLVLEDNAEKIEEIVQEFIPNMVINFIRSKKFVEACLDKGVPEKDILSFVSSTYYEEYIGEY